MLNDPDEDFWDGSTTNPDMDSQDFRYEESFEEPIEVQVVEDGATGIMVREDSKPIHINCQIIRDAGSIGIDLG